MTPSDFQPVEYPCEGCGDAVVVKAAGDSVLPANNWSEGLLAFWCPSCWTEHAASQPASPPGEGTR